MLKTTPDKYFRFDDGTKLKDIEDLKNWLEEVIQGEHKDKFIFHIKNNNNDFANWLRDVFYEKKLAENVEKTDSPEDMYEKILLFLKKENSSEKEEEKKESKEEEKQAFEEKQPVKQTDDKKPTFINSSEEMNEKMKKMKKNSRKNLNSEEIHEKLIEEYNQITTQISEARKKGKDMFIPSVKIKNIRPKIKYAEVTQKQEDIRKVENIFKEIRNDIEEEIEKKEIDLKKEIEEEYKKQKLQEHTEQEQKTEA